MQFKYFLLITCTASAALYLYLDKPLQTEILGKVYRVAPVLNQSTLYKWKNKKGQWQVTDKAPRAGVAFTTIRSQDQLNVMPSSSFKKKK